MKIIPGLVSFTLTGVSETYFGLLFVDYLYWFEAEGYHKIY